MYAKLSYKKIVLCLFITSFFSVYLVHLHFYGIFIIILITSEVECVHLKIVKCCN